MYNALKYTTSNPLESEETYPYVLGRKTCYYDKSKGLVGAITVHNVPQNDNAQLRAAVSNGPVSVAVNAYMKIFQHYTGGIINSPDCNKFTDHGVVIVGYGEDYWIVKNSWGADWGEKGYFRLADVAGAGICGVNTAANYADTN